MKKVFCVLLSVVIVMSCFVFSVSAFEIDDLYRNIIDGKWNLGDVDLDDTITSADARLALRAAVGLEHFEKDSKQYKASDYNKDGEITAGDALFAFQHKHYINVGAVSLHNSGFHRLRLVFHRIDEDVVSVHSMSARFEGLRADHLKRLYGLSQPLLDRKVPAQTGYCRLNHMNHPFPV